MIFFLSKLIHTTLIPNSNINLTGSEKNVDAYLAKNEFRQNLELH